MGMNQNMCCLCVPAAADGPGDRFIIGESQAGEQVRKEKI